MSVVENAPKSIDPSQLPCDICLCSVCDPGCGKHKLCRPTRTVYGHLESSTEYGSNYIKFPTNLRLKFKPHLEIDLRHGSFPNSTENRAAFVAHPLPPQPYVREMVWVKNPGQFESVTTQKTDFPVWPNIEPPKVRERRKYFSTPGFSDKTTNKDDYRDFGAQQKYQIPRKPYIPNNYKFDYHTTQQEDFRDTGKVARPTPHKAAPYIQVADNRDFQSTNNMTYRSLQSHRELKGPDRERELLEGCKFRGSTTTAEAFQVWELPPRETKKEVQIIKTDAPLEAVTTYGESFYAKKLQPRETINKDTSSAATNLKFEATSTNRADYKPNPVTGVVKKPKQVYVTVDDTRDFKTSTNFYFNKKEIPHCDASLISNLPHEKRADGHIYVKAQP